MRTRAWSLFAAAILASFGGVSPLARGQVVLQYTNAGSQGMVTIHSLTNQPISSMYSQYSILRTTNFQTWQSVVGPFSGGVGVSDELLRNLVPPGGDFSFYRVLASSGISPDGGLGDAVYGYGTAFSQQLQQIGQLPLDVFASTYTPTNPYLPQISFDPTTATYWTNVNGAFPLNSNELAILATNGFVVAGRMSYADFGDSYHQIFIHDLPVYFSPDAALHAWHRSYDSMLEELEESYVAPTLQTVVQRMQGSIANMTGDLFDPPQASADGLADADYFLAVADSLITGINNYGVLGQNGQVLATLTAISNLQPASITIFGTNRYIDFSQFQVRGHYTTSPQLQQYFRAMMWCGLIDFRFTGTTNDNSFREFEGAVALNQAMQLSGQFANWHQMDAALQMFAGLPDSLNFAQLNDLITAANVQPPNSLADPATLSNLQAQIMAGQLGTQNIQSGYFVSPLTAEQLKLPRSFTFLGQRFEFDAWAMNQCVFDRILWNTNGIPSVTDKVLRRVPSALDVAFSVLANNQTTPLIASRISNQAGKIWRDGYPYQHNLTAVRRVIDARDPSVWTNNIYDCWLASLRELSAPTTAPEYPDALRTAAWAMKTLNTQLASWTELRHDTVLYAKQPYSSTFGCSYPDAFIEPNTNFWQRMADMALRTRDLVATLPSTGTFTFQPNVTNGTPFTVSNSVIYANRIQFLTNFAARMTTLCDIAARELSRQALTSNEIFFEQSLIENPNVYDGDHNNTGWYPGIFYMNARAMNSTALAECNIADQLVTDVFTDTTDEIVGDPGSILHEGVGNIQLLTVAVNWGPGDAAVYIGPVLSHYEFQLGPTTRETDAQWQSDLSLGKHPVPPDWTTSYLVPDTYTVPSGVQ